MRIWRPVAIDDALSILRSGDGQMQISAGTTALQMNWARGETRPECLIDLTRIEVLKGVAISEKTLRVGALSVLGDLAVHPDIARHLPLLGQALRTVAAPSIRNLATLGGNLATRNGCLIPALLALDCVVDCVSVTGAWSQSLEDWLSMPPHPFDIVTALSFPLDEGDCRDVWRKVGLRAAFTPSVINVAARLTVRDDRYRNVRLAVGGGVVPPKRLHAAEADLEGCEIDRVDWHAIHAEIEGTVAAPDDDFRTGSYRRMVAANALVHGLGGLLPRAPALKLPPEQREAIPVEDEITLSRPGHPERWHIRPDIRHKVTASFPYLTDHREPDMLVARILRAGIAHAEILSIDTSAAEALDGVAAVVTHRDIAGENAFGIVIQDQPALCFDKVRHAGDPVAAVAAKNAEIAEKALALIKVEYRPLPLVTEPSAALEADAASVHENGNLQRALHYRRGDSEAAFRAAAHIVEDLYVTPRQMHGFMETEGGYAQLLDDGSLLVAVGGQHGLRDRLQLSRILGWPEERIRVITSPTGGGFGGKDELSVQPALALLALKTGRAVRLQLSRAESVLAGQKRNPMTIRMKAGCDQDGKLVALEVDVLADAGAYASLGPGVLETALEHAAGPYLVDNVTTHGRIAYTNNGTCGAFRGFGANQMTYAIESHMDRLAALAELDPVEIRRRNLRQPGMKGYLGQDVAGSERLVEMLRAAEASPLWTRPQGLSEDGEWLVGTGMALNYQGNGLGSLVPDPAGGRLALTPDGYIEGAYGLDEMGQGLMTLIQACISAELGCSRDDVRAVVGDTGRAPDSGSTTASRGTSVVWAVARKAAPHFRAKICEAAGRCLGRNPDTLLLAPGGIAERGSNSGEVLISYRALASSLSREELPSVTIAYEFPKNDHSEGNARFLFAFGAALTRVAVNRLTGEVRVLDLHQHSAAGPVMDMAAYLGQLEGGAIQALGFTFFEDVAMREGRAITRNLDTYMMPGIADIPQEMTIFALESLDDNDPHGPRGSGELGIGAVTPAIANAVAAATGCWPARTPFPPEDILRALEGRR